LAPFDSTSKEETSVWSTVQSVQRPVLGLLGLVLMAVVALAALKSLKTPGSALAPARVAAGAGPSYVPQLSSGGDVMPQMPPRPAAIPAFGLNESVVKQRVVATVDQQPDQAARLVRSWLKEA
jgi:flagellar biosynthesis/type III secretory pathway M-ring protein FliF/YscJ